MSRHTELDGTTPDPRIIDGISYDEHWKVLAPPASLVGRWHRGELGALNKDTFDNKFTPAYLKHLEQDDAKSTVETLGKRALREDITVLCYEPSPKPGDILLCHRNLLIAHCAEITEGLEYKIQ
ncbi:MAG: DUF488 family protein [Patescibacteria group bacterium]